MVRKARLLYGDKKDFKKFSGPALSQGWTEERQNRVIIANYGNAIEYLGKLIDDHEDSDRLVFYRDACAFSDRFVQLLAGINGMDIASSRSMYGQALAARIRPNGLERDLMSVSGFDGKKRDAGKALASAKRLMRWAADYLKGEYGAKMPALY